MTHKRPWFWPVIGLAAFIASIVAQPASANCGGGMSATEQRVLTDFLILAVKPDGDDKDYKLIEIGQTKIDAGLLGVVVNALPLKILGIDLGSSDRERTYNPTAEANQCRAACAANEQCRSFAYVPPNARQQLGVCHLKTLAEETSSYSVMTPVSGPGDRAPGVGTTIDIPHREPQPASAEQPAGTRIVFNDSDASGSAHYPGDNARTSPLTLRFTTPVSQVKILLRAAETGEQKTYAVVDAFDARGKRVARAGTPISSSGEMNFGRGVAVESDGDRISTIKIYGREGAMLLIDAIDYARTPMPPVYTDYPVVVATLPQQPAPREVVPPPPRLPPITVAPMPMPPRAVAEAPPQVIYNPTPPAIVPTVAPVVVATPAPMPSRKPLPLWLAAASIAFVLGGAGVYNYSHRKRMLTRVTTRLVSNGLDRHTVSVQTADRPDIGLRFVVRSSAAIGASGTHIDLIPAGAIA